MSDIYVPYVIALVTVRFDYGLFATFAVPSNDSCLYILKIDFTSSVLKRNILSKFIILCDNPVVVSEGSYFWK